jgi:hypothetical protein
MATTYTLISSNVLASSAASVTFSSIPGTYTDLVLRISTRSSNTDAALSMTFNSDTSTNYSRTFLRADGSSAASGRSSNTDQIGNLYISNSGNTANTFGSMEIYIPSYLASQNKPVSSIGIEETNSATANMATLAALWRNTAAITTINLFPISPANFVSGSSFYLYGIKNS